MNIDTKKQLVYDPITSQYFTVSKEEYLRIQNELNTILKERKIVTLRDVYKVLGMDTMKFDIFPETSYVLDETRWVIHDDGTTEFISAIGSP